MPASRFEIDDQADASDPHAQVVADKGHCGRRAGPSYLLTAMVRPDYLKEI